MSDYKVYTCDQCHKRYKAPLVKTVMCAVLHLNGQCCHYGEKIVKEVKA